MNIINYLEAGIKAEAARQKAIANNVANTNTPGYRRSDVRFEQALAKVIKSGEKLNVSDSQIQTCQPKTTPVNANGNDVSLDNEIGEMVKNTLRHRTFMLLLRKKYQQINEAIGAS